jgi:hypothetical protein
MSNKKIRRQHQEATKVGLNCAFKQELHCLVATCAICVKLTMRLEVEEGKQKSAIWKAGVGVSNLVKKWVNKCLHLDKRFTGLNTLLLSQG